MVEIDKGGMKVGISVWQSYLMQKKIIFSTTFFLNKYHKKHVLFDRQQ